MARGRIFTREFKLEAVREVVSGEKRPAQVCRERALAEGLLLRWRRARSSWSARWRSWSASAGNSPWRTRP